MRKTKPRKPRNIPTKDIMMVLRSTFRSLHGDSSGKHFRTYTPQQADDLAGICVQLAFHCGAHAMITNIAKQLSENKEAEDEFKAVMKPFIQGLETAKWNLLDHLRETWMGITEHEESLDPPPFNPNSPWRK